MRRSRLLSIFLVVFIDLLGFGLILPLLPYYAGAYGASAIIIGGLAGAYAAAQFIGAPLLGRLSDRFGRRPILVVSIAGTALSFIILGWPSRWARRWQASRWPRPVVSSTSHCRMRRSSA
jgi:MFS transporter, DHA1 family, tetracycline resistance protein